MPLPTPPPLKAINSFLDPPPLPWEGRRRALLIGINYQYEKCDKYPPLKGPSNDIKKMRQLLISQYQFGDHEIVMMTDDDEKMSGTDLWPTCDNIVKQIDVLVHDAEPHDFFIFHFAGHCSQQDAVDDPTEVDGLNEVLIGCDFRGLVDDKIHATLVDPLPKKSRLTAILDACHSGTMLDLELYEADSQPRSLSESRMGSDKGPEVQVEILQHDASTWQNTKSRYASMKIKMMAIVRFSRAGRKQKSRRAKHLFTCGEQCQHTLHADAVVVSLSACLDHQVTWEDRRDQGGAMTDTLVKILEKDPAITLRDVEQQLRSNLRTTARKRHVKFRKMVKKKVKECAPAEELQKLKEHPFYHFDPQVPQAGSPLRDRASSATYVPSLFQLGGMRELVSQPMTETLMPIRRLPVPFRQLAVPTDIRIRIPSFNVSRM